MIAVVRIRGSIDVRKDIEDSLRMLNLSACNQAVVLPENSATKGMIAKVQDYATFGTVNEETLASMLQKRARLEGNKKISAEFLKERKIAGFEELAKKLISGEASLKALGIKPVFRLSPPRKGFERGGIKKSFRLGGALGNRGEKINSLLEKMV